MTVERNKWSHDNLSDIIWYLDPDQVAHFFVSLVEHEREIEHDTVYSALDLFDADKCPTEYLPYLGDMVGVKLDKRDREESHRAQIKTAVAWYKEKGKINSFSLVFQSLGMNLELYPLWINEHGEVEREPADSSWKPHARIDLVIREHPDWQRYFPDNVQYVLNKMEEVRPIHVLLRGIFLGWDFFDVFPTQDIEDILIGKVTGNLNDYWESVYWSSCGIWHFPEPQPGIERNGGNYTWNTLPVNAIEEIPPIAPLLNSRYIVGTQPQGAWEHQENNIAEWDGIQWVFTPPIENGGVWIFNNSTNDADWTWKYFLGFIWRNGGALYETSKLAPGPYFRECTGTLYGAGGGPIDEYKVKVKANMEDALEHCLFHNNKIHARNGTYLHSCIEILDDCSLQLSELPSETFVVPNETPLNIGLNHEEYYNECIYHDGAINLRNADYMHSCKSIIDVLSLDYAMEDSTRLPFTWDMEHCIAHNRELLIRDGLFQHACMPLDVYWDQGQQYDGGTVQGTFDNLKIIQHHIIP